MTTSLPPPGIVWVVGLTDGDIRKYVASDIMMFTTAIAIVLGTIPARVRYRHSRDGEHVVYFRAGRPKYRNENIEPEERIHGVVVVAHLDDHNAWIRIRNNTEARNLCT